ncbi:secreted RxLR effector protein 161-like [Cicer arietinum]|uniref:secreted RxLR effector protein 161-like n=1 Tax=Cicer arietinum TaxID=3827 RepID=UPI003CC581E1
MKSIPYASAIRSVMYAMVCSRPGISHVVSVTSRFTGNPGMNHWLDDIWILRYLKRTQSMCLEYNKSSEPSKPIQGFVDSDFAGDLDRRTSLTGYVFMVFNNTVSWKANLQHIVALSSIEA